MNGELLEKLFPATVGAEKAQAKKAAEILRNADTDLLDVIKERACIRWANGFSDSLYMAVLSNLAPTGEITERDSTGEIILREKTDWEAELKKYRS